MFKTSSSVLTLNIQLFCARILKISKRSVGPISVGLYTLIIVTHPQNPLVFLQSSPGVSLFACYPAISLCIPLGVQIRH